MTVTVNPPSQIKVTAVSESVYSVTAVNPTPISVTATTTGATGLSAYEVWLGQGHTGSEADFLAWLVGPQGAAGLSATIAVGSVTKGDTASVTNSGTSSSAIFDFVLPKGDQGEQGIQGEPGPDGPQGDAATIQVGTVTTGLAGSSAVITNSGSSSAAVFDFTIPRGDTGSVGDVYWNDVKEKPNYFTPTTHGNTSHTVNYATETALADKVDKVTGKGLSTNDYTATDLARVAEIPGIDIAIENLQSTGLLYGGGLSINADNTKFDIQAGAGIVVNNYTNAASPVRTVVTWNTQTEIPCPGIATSATTYVNIDSSGNFHYTYDTILSATERRDYIAVGWLDHPDNATITAVKIEPYTNTDIQAQLNDFFDSFGAFNILGNEYSNAATDLTVKRTAGKTFASNSNYWVSRKSPHIITTDLETGVSFQYYYRDGHDGWVDDLSPVSVIDPNHYDDNTGTLASVTPTYWTIQALLFYAPTDVNDFQYGQVQYSSYSLALSALQNAIDINPYNDYDTFRGWLIVKQGATDLSDPTQAVFRSTGKLGIIDVQSGGGTGGEVNTASNIGTAGIGLFQQKVGVDLQFRNIEAGSSLITVAIDSGNNAIKIDTIAASKSFAVAMAVALG
jgi:hypothetical protein